MPQISVIVPVYNVEKYIHPCIDSILAQTFTDFELILVDDGSPDNCGSICDEYAKKDSRVRVIHQINSGVSAARNHGLEIARGQYICFIDSDDMLHAEYCQTLLNLLKDTKYDFSACATLRFWQDDRLIESTNPRIITSFSNAEFFSGQIEHLSEMGPWNKLFRKDALQNIRFTENRRYEDVLFSTDLAQKLCGGVIYTNQQLYNYRQQPDGFMSTQAVSKMVDFVEAGRYLLMTASVSFPEYKPICLRYAIEYPWFFIDPIYVKRDFRENKSFLSAMQKLLYEHIEECQQFEIFPQTILKRMELFSKSKVLYGFNAYARLLRVYLYRLLGKDAYRDGHGI